MTFHASANTISFNKPFAKLNLILITNYPETEGKDGLLCLIRSLPGFHHTPILLEKINKSAWIWKVASEEAAIQAQQHLQGRIIQVHNIAYYFI